MVKGSGAKRLMTIGMYLGDKNSCYSVLDRDGEVVREGSVGTTKKAMTQVFGRSAVVGSQSRWGRILHG